MSLPVFAPAIAANRFGLGARPDGPAPADPRADLLAQLDRFRADAFPAVAGSAAVTARLVALRETYGQDPAARMEARRIVRKQAQDDYSQAVRARAVTALTTATPFAERLAHFWANHFTVSADKLETLGLAHTLEVEAIRPNLNRRFADLLLAVVRHPAMLLYLDQAQSIGPGSEVGTRAAARRPRADGQPPRPVGLNENLAREILELHTLGVDGGYTQADVSEFARALTGWSVGGFARRGPLARLSRDAPDGAFVFQPAWHEPGDRRLLGTRYRQGGATQAEAMLATLASHPATARHLATKLARHFVADNPPPALVARLADSFLQGRGDLPTLHRALASAPESWAAPAAKVRSPWDWLIAALRGAGLSDLPGFGIVPALNALGQPPWRPGSPAGWGDTAATWAAPDALMRRVETAQRLAALLPAALDARTLAPRLLPGTLTPTTANAITAADSGAQALALLFLSPEFLRR
ncbi:DUF1800 domain-containing protein [Sandaracinobacteroides saxicola]|uniref:DUF1800 domain-containing protein n=1 Tax=Sandaracinobacteroides saxicola TaxID=2759707 RepID=A0A7G5II64_9SPHN|nr:DUF1800 domain-containing protein [Sandaracinobacteroides saxicola]QMW23056.1 DUF1800 domain-containing protein [Sandaracinobacteroides saxicola]